MILYVDILVGRELMISGKILHIAITLPFFVYCIWYMQKRVVKIRELEKKQRNSN